MGQQPASLSLALLGRAVGDSLFVVPVFISLLSIHNAQNMSTYLKKTQVDVYLLVLQIVCAHYKKKIVPPCTTSRRFLTAFWILQVHTVKGKIQKIYAVTLTCGTSKLKLWHVSTTSLGISWIHFRLLKHILKAVLHACSPIITMQMRLVGQQIRCKWENGKWIRKKLTCLHISGSSHISLDIHLCHSLFVRFVILVESCIGLAAPFHGALQISIFIMQFISICWFQAL